MATAYHETDGSVSIGRAFNHAFGTIGSNPLATLGIAFLFGALPGLVINYISRQMRGALIAKVGIAGVFGASLIVILLSIVFATITQGALVRTTLAHTQGRRATIGESVGAAVAVLVPLILLSLLIALGVGLGMLLLFIPGILFYVMWSVASPALVAERIGVSEAISRSNYLTKGARWKVFGVMLLIVVFYYMCAGAIGAAAVAIYGGVQGFIAAMQGGAPVWYLLMNAVVQTLMAAVWATLQTALYVELRNWKDGPDTDALADVFA